MSDSAAEKTEYATPKRRQKERDEGHISRSQDYTSALMITIGLALLGAFASYFINKITGMMRFTFSQLTPQYLNNNDIIALFVPYFKAKYVIIIMGVIINE